MPEKNTSYHCTDFIRNLDFWKKIYLEERVRYIIVGDEICPQTQRAHYQVFIWFESKRSQAAIRKLLKPRHVEAKYYNATEADGRKYCSKDQIVYEDGYPPKQGERTDLKALAEKIQNGARLDEIIQSNPYAYHVYGRTLTKIEDICNRKIKRTWMTAGIWIHGPTGTGKSHTANELAKQYASVYKWKDDKGWWDDYNGQEVVILEDFRGGIPYNQLLQIIDKWEYSVSRRGRPPAPFLAKLVIITSALSPSACYYNLAHGDGIDQLLRRIDIREMSKKWTGSSPQK